MPDLIAPLATLRDESDLSSADAAYLTRIRGAMSRIGRRSESDDRGLAAALADVGDAAVIDVDVPTASRKKTGELLKRVIKKLTRWYLRYLAQQTTVLGQATLRLGTAVVETTDRLDDTTRGLVDEVARLRERVELLERQLPQRQVPQRQVPHRQASDRQVSDRQGEGEASPQVRQ